MSQPSDRDGARWNRQEPSIHTTQSFAPIYLPDQHPPQPQQEVAWALLRLRQ